MSPRLCEVFSWIWLTNRISHILNQFECKCNHLEKPSFFFFFSPQNIASCRSSIYAAARQASLSCLPWYKSDSRPLARAPLQTQCLQEPKSLLHLYGSPLLGVGKRQEPQHHKVHVGKWRNVCLRSDSEETIKRKGNSRNKKRMLCDKGCLKQKCQGFWFFYRCSSCLYLNTC